MREGSQGEDGELQKGMVRRGAKGKMVTGELQKG